jgi:hypothetical protein
MRRSDRYQKRIFSLDLVIKRTYHELFDGRFIMDGMASEIGRDAAGRFVPGQSGNPAGKRPGTKNRKTVLLEALRNGEGEAAARVVIERALAGDAVAARFVVSLISPRPRGRTIQIEMPEDDDCNVVAAYNATLRALCTGEITPDEALQVSRFLDGRRRVLQAWQLEDKLTAYGRTIPGDPEWAEDDDEDAADEPAEDEDAPAPDEAATALAAEASSDLAGPTPADPGLVLQSPCNSPVPASPPVMVTASEAPSLPRFAATPAAPAPEASRLQATCISGAPGPLHGMVPVPQDAFDAALAASVARRLAVGAAAP